MRKARKRGFRHESLESRRLLAGDCLPLDPSVEPAVESVVVESGLPDATGESRPVLTESLRPGSNVSELSLWLGSSHVPDLIKEVGDHVFVVDPAGRNHGASGSRLFVFERTESGQLEKTNETVVDFEVTKLIVHDGQAILIGQNVTSAVHDGFAAGDRNGVANDFEPFFRTAIVSVNMADDYSIQTQSIPGRAYAIEHDGDRLAILTTTVEAIIAIYPPPAVQGTLTTFDLSGGQLRDSGSIGVEASGFNFGFTEINGTSLYSARNRFVDGIERPDVNGDDAGDQRQGFLAAIPLANLNRFGWSEDGIAETASVELGEGLIQDFRVSADGQTGWVVMRNHSPAGPSSSVVLLDLSGDQVQVFDTVRLPDTIDVQVVFEANDVIVVRSYGDNQLRVINVNQEIDIDTESRVSTIEIDDIYSPKHFLQVDSDRLAIRAQDVDPNVQTIRAKDSVLLIVSVSEASVLSAQPLPPMTYRGSESMVLISQENAQFGVFVFDEFSVRLFGEAPSEEGTGYRFVHGRLNESGEFDQEGAISVDGWREVDVDSQRLLVRQANQLSQFDWESGDVVVTPFDAQSEQFKAVNDHFRLPADGEDHRIDVLRNDLLPLHLNQPTEIAELIGAADGILVTQEQRILIPADVLARGDSLRFEYVIVSGDEQSRAVVEIEVIDDRDRRVRELVQTVRAHAAEEYDVEVDRVVVTSVQRLFDQDDPDIASDLLVTLDLPENTVVYSASFDGEIELVSATPHEPLVELGLTLTDTDGQSINEVMVGETFFIQFDATDLRRGGSAVFAAFFDLVVPTSGLVITGPVEYGPGYVGIDEGGFSETEIDDLGAILSDAFEPDSQDRPHLLRIAARAVEPGAVTLQPEPADGLGTGTLIYGIDNEIQPDRVNYRSVTVNVVETQTNPLDTNLDGQVSPVDALRVINALRRHGSIVLDEIEQRSAEGEDLIDHLAQMRALDTNGSGTVTPLDALVVINGIRRGNVSPQIAAIDPVESEDETDTEPRDDAPAELF